MRDSIGRMFCAEGVLLAGMITPCLQPSEVFAPDGSGMRWAYCRKHAALEHGRLGIVIDRKMAAGEAAVGERVKRDAIGAALGLAQ